MVDSDPPSVSPARLTLCYRAPFARAVERSPIARWLRRFILQLLVPLSLLAVIAIALRSVDPSARKALAAAIVAAMAVWLLDAGRVSRPSKTAPAHVQRPVTWLWLASSVVLIAALYLPGMVATFIKLEEDRACMRTAQVWLARSRPASPSGWQVTCHSPVIDGVGR